MQLEILGHINSAPDGHYFTVALTFTLLLPSLHCELILGVSYLQVHIKEKN